MGRAAIGTAFREDKTARKVTLSKRKKGIYKKCQELAQVRTCDCYCRHHGCATHSWRLSQLCAVEIAVMCVGQAPLPYPKP